mmetsp:Transcript_34170/g.102215  ORF Transcript_34170/g.102215 Transcript_34170/m.102215 type:complete len:98 (-) Transcript_34170:2102-2395(-)
MMPSDSVSLNTASWENRLGRYWALSLVHHWAHCLVLPMVSNWDFRLAGHLDLDLAHHLGSQMDHLKVTSCAEDLAHQMVTHSGYQIFPSLASHWGSH